MTDKYVTRCPYCGGSEIITTCQTAYGAVTNAESILHSAELYHSVCRNCGSVLRSFVKDPEKLLKKKDRRYKDEMF